MILIYILSDWNGLLDELGKKLNDRLMDSVMDYKLNIRCGHVV